MAVSDTVAWDWYKHCRHRKHCKHARSRTTKRPASPIAKEIGVVRSFRFKIEWIPKLDPDQEISCRNCLNIYLCVYCKFSVFDRKIECLWFSSALASKGSVYNGLGGLDIFLVKFLLRKIVGYPGTENHECILLESSTSVKQVTRKRLATLIMSHFATNHA